MYMHLACLTLNVFGCTFQRAIVVTLLAAHFFFVVVLKTTIRTLFVKTTSILVVTSILGSNKWQLSSSLQFYKYCLLLHVGFDVGNRWKDLYHLWESHTDDHILVRAVISLCTPFLTPSHQNEVLFSQVFNDVHMLMCTLGAKNEDATLKLMASLRDYVRYSCRGVLILCCFTMRFQQA